MYPNESKNVDPTISQMCTEEKWDKVIQGLKQSMRLEVMKSVVNTIEEAGKEALTIDSAILGANGV